MKYLCVSIMNQILIYSEIHAVFRHWHGQKYILHSIKNSGNAASVATKLRRLALCAVYY